MAELRGLAELPSDEIWEAYRDVQVVGDDVWFSATLTERTGRRRLDGLFRTDAGAIGLELVTTMAVDDRIEGFIALSDRSVHLNIATYDHQLTVVGRHRAGIGPLADFLASGWSPLLDSTQPEFGFHAIPA
jgi:hypothetical protein